jgi:maleate cis-trans isomerase
MSTELIKIEANDNIETITTSSGVIQQVGAIEIKMIGNYAYWRPTASGNIDFIPFA